MSWQSRSRSLYPCILALLLMAGAQAAGAAPLVVYDDQLRNGFDDWSWAAGTLFQTAVVHSGTAAASFEPDNWDALFLHRDLGINTAEYEALEFWIHGGPNGRQKLEISLTIEGDAIGRAPLDGFISGGAVPAGQWARVRVPFASLGVTSGSFNGFWIQDDTGGDQAAVYVDDIQLIDKPPAPIGPIPVTIDPSADRRPVSPLIYGVAFGSAAQAQRMRWPVRRWGGNATTRYSWQIDYTNHANDWFFLNDKVREYTRDPANLPHSSAVNRFIDETRAAGGQPLITLSMIGWMPIDATHRWGFSVAKYGAQQATECTESGWASWCKPDAGNGVRTDGTLITGNDPFDTSRQVGPSFITSWMQHIASRVGTAGNGGVKFFALDNEPMLWHSTHRDVHPSKLTYDGLWQRTVQYASAIKAQDPAAQLFGPVTWGWCDLFYSAADNCRPGADYAAHGNMPLLEWYLKQVRDHELANGVRLVDWVDLHYYPEGTNIALSDDESPAVAAHRLRSIKSLYDPNYLDESWIGKPIYLIPRVKAWIAARLPGAKLAITEYNFGNDNGVSSALAQAEVLAIFGREGVDLASRWRAPKDGSLMEDAFLLYLNYDGQGSKVAGDSVRAVSANVDAVGAYAVRGTGASASRLYVLLFNKDTVERHVDVQLPAGTLAGTPASLYRFGAQRLGAAGTASVSGGGLSLDLPQRSATLVVLQLASGVP
jgi:Glycoside hydrolase family 44